MTLDADRRRSHSAASQDLRRTDHLSRLRETNEEPWGAFLFKTAIKTAVVLAVGGVVLFVMSIVLK